MAALMKAWSTPKTLAFADFVVAQDRPSGPAIPFDFCIYGLTFYR